MGPEAIPKLSAVLQENADRQRRFYAVYCIANIGGPSAVSSLNESLVSETDKCVRHLMRVSLESLNSEGEISDRDKWLAGGMCDDK